MNIAGQFSPYPPAMDNDPSSGTLSMLQVRDFLGREWRLIALVAGLSIEVAVIEEHKRRHVQKGHDDECGSEQLFFIHAARITGDAYLIKSIYIFCILILSIFLAGEREVSHAKDKTNAAYRTDMTHASDECEPAKRHMEPIPSGLE